ncbi:MAG: class I SAM-dependent methyltransferase [Patescibacteria group bacterium]|nr:class I SAM-dependent methyltransferase [Patescibacteria group bacterium]
MAKQNELFGQVAKEYQKHRSSYDLRTYKFLASLLGGRSRQYKILDIGCGTGKSTEPLTEIFKNAEIIGCDPDKAMLAEARRRAEKLKLPIEYIEARAEKLPFADNYFDAVIAGTALHWFGTKKAVKEINRVLKRGGLFYVFWRFFKENGSINWLKIRRKYIIKSMARKFKDNLPRLKKLFKESGFIGNKFFSIPFKENKTIADEIGAIKTNAAYMMLPEKRKKAYIKEITREYKKIQGKNKFIIDQREIFIFYGFKK